MNWNEVERMIDRAILLIAAALAFIGLVFVIFACVILIVEASKLLWR